MQNFARFLKELRPYWRVMAIVVVLTLVTAALSLPPPYILKYLTDSLSDAHVRAHWQVPLARVFIILVALSTASSFVGYWLSYAVTYLGQRFKYDMRRKLYTHIQSLSLGYFEKASTGKLMSNITNDVASLDQLIGGSFVTVLQDVVMLVSALGFLFYLNWKMALVALSVYPLYILNYKLFIGKIKLASHEVREQREVLYGDLQEKAGGRTGGALVCARTGGSARICRGNPQPARPERSHDRVFHRPCRPVGIYRQWVRNCALLLWYGGGAVMRGEMTPGSLIAFYGYMGGYVYQPTQRLIQLNDQIARVNTALWRIFTNLDTKPNVEDKPGMRFRIARCARRCAL